VRTRITKTVTDTETDERKRNAGNQATKSCERAPAAGVNGRLVARRGGRRRPRTASHQLGTLCLLVAENANQFSVEDDEDDERHEEHDDEVEQVGVDDAVDGVGRQRGGLRHQDRRGWRRLLKRNADDAGVYRARR